MTSHYKEAIHYVNSHFSEYYGEANPDFIYPSTEEQAVAWLEDFLCMRFNEFGTYEDAIISNESILHHSMLTPRLNIGLITPKQIINKALYFAEKNNMPLNSLEGFYSPSYWLERVHVRAL